MYSAALTGNAASGKSTLAELWRSEGISVLQADDLARRALAPGSAALEAVRESFGARALTEAGELDRRWMRELVFSDGEARRRLEAIVHPEVRRLRTEREEELRRQGVELVVSEIPLLFEAGLEGDFDCVVLVDADPEVRLRRLMDSKGFDRELAGRLMASQGDPAAKREPSRFVIENNAGLDMLAVAGRRVLAELRQLAGMALRMDLHIHTWSSFDSLSRPELVLDRALARGCGRIALTDHDRIGAAALMADRYPALVIPGEEVKSREGVDVIGLYLSLEIPRRTPAREAIRQIRDQGGVPYLPHPYAPGKGGDGRMAEELGPLCDVIEVFNGRLHSTAPQKKAAALRTRLGKVPGAGSDAHTLGEVGRSTITVESHPNEPEALVDALAGGVVNGRMSSRLVHLGSTWAKFRKKLAGGPWTEPEVEDEKGGADC